MTWDKYDKNTQEALKNNPAINNAIRQMYQDGHDKEYTQKITGAPYEVVDRLFKHQEKMNSGHGRRDSGPRREEEE